MLEIKFQDAAMYLCIDKYGPAKNLSGRIYNSFYENKIDFMGIEEFVIKTEDCINQIGYPGNSYQLRIFYNSKLRKKRRGIDGKKYYNKEEIENKRGKLGSFIIFINDRKDATWKGKIKSLDKGNNFYFRSELELIGIIESELDNTSFE